MKTIYQEMDESSVTQTHTHGLIQRALLVIIQSYLSKASQALAQCEAYHSITMEASLLDQIIRAQKTLFKGLCNLLLQPTRANLQPCGLSGVRWGL